MTYQIEDSLLQAIVGTLNELPAKHARPLLNALEATCREQDEASARRAEADQRAAIEAEVKAALSQAAEVKA